MNEKTIEQLALEAKARGNEIEVHSSKEGLKVFEVSKKLVKEIKVAK